MSPEERDELMEFILQSQSNAAAERRETAKEHREIMEQHRQVMKEHRDMAKQHRDMAKEHRDVAKEHRDVMKVLKRNTTQIEALTTASHNLLKVAQIHSRRLDRLEGLSS